MPLHSDCGSQYASRDFLDTITARGCAQHEPQGQLLGQRGGPESFFATLKNEEAIGVYETRAQAYAAIASYIHGFYNPTVLHSALGYLLSSNGYARTLKHAG